MDQVWYLKPSGLLLGRLWLHGLLVCCIERLLLLVLQLWQYFHQLLVVQLSHQLERVHWKCSWRRWLKHVTERDSGCIVQDLLVEKTSTGLLHLLELLVASAALVPSLAMIHAIHVASAHAATATTLEGLRLWLAHLQIAAGTFSNLDLLLLDSSDLPVNLFNLVLQRLFLLLDLFELLLDAKSVIGLQDLLVDKIAPRFRV